jgi:CheY-like chemotaxis protein
MAADTSVQNVFVRVVGFTDVERHALNTVFRLSEQRETVYRLWVPGAPDAAKLALVDGEHHDSASLPREVAQGPCQLIWVGEGAPTHAWRKFQRPLSWPDVLDAMDELHASPDNVELDLDFDVDQDTLPPEVEETGRRALIASADRDERLYLRAKLALAELPHADEAETGAQALQLARSREYAVALLDFSMPDVDGWLLLKELRHARPGVPHVIITKDGGSAGQRVRAWWAGAAGCFEKPPHPGKLHELLQRL